jgi:hypothetical protein
MEPTPLSQEDTDELDAWQAMHRVPAIRNPIRIEARIGCEIPARSDVGMPTGAVFCGRSIEELHIPPSNRLSFENRLSKRMIFLSAIPVELDSKILAPWFKPEGKLNLNQRCHME